MGCNGYDDPAMIYRPREDKWWNKCGLYDNSDFEARKMCCHCGGGSLSGKYNIKIT